MSVAAFVLPIALSLSVRADTGSCDPSLPSGAVAVDQLGDVISPPPNRPLVYPDDVTEDDHFGDAIVGLPDLDGDGIREVAIGSPFRNVSSETAEEGAVLIFSGQDVVEGVPSWGDPLLIIEGYDSGLSLSAWGFGAALEAADLDGDGTDDLVVGAPDSDAVLIYLAASLEVLVADAVASGSPLVAWGEYDMVRWGTAGSRYGATVEKLPAPFHGDCDGLVVGAPRHLNKAGRVVLALPAHAPEFRCMADDVGPIEITWDFVIDGNANYELGTALAAADFDGDGALELAIGSPGASSNKGVVWIQDLSPGGIYEDYELFAPQVITTASNDRLGASLAVADLGGATGPALVIGAPGKPVLYVGKAFVVASPFAFGTLPANVSTVASASLQVLSPLVPNSSAHAGSAVASGGDLDGDGHDEVLVGAAKFGTDDGSVYLYTGWALENAIVSSLQSDPGQNQTSDLAILDLDLRMTAPATSDGDVYLGAALAFVGDVYGNGFDDLVVGAPHLDQAGFHGTTAVDAGAVYVVPGGGHLDPVGYVDRDGDGYGGHATRVCVDGPPYTVANGDDCDDDLADVSPSSPELCGNGVDDDCNGTIDDAVLWYADADGDGFGDAATTTASCEVPLGSWSADATDCDDAEARVYPGASYFEDGDGDGQPGTVFTLAPEVCLPPTASQGFDDPDCDDGDDTVYLGATEVVGDAIDQDCDGQLACFEDLDADGYGAGTTLVPADGTNDCAVAGVAEVGGDCLDDPAVVGAADVSPAAIELVGNAVDEDCDGLVDCYVDGDEDGFGAPGTAVARPTNLSPWEGACLAEDGASANDEDCDDASASFHPGASWYEDADEDGWGAGPLRDCDPDGAWVAGASQDGDCDPADPGVYPGATFYADQDGDTWGDEASPIVLAEGTCRTPDLGEASRAGDCLDDDPTVPGAVELDGNAVDDDCDGWFGCYRDDDEDTYGTAEVLLVEAASGEQAGVCQAAGLAENADDCDDQDPLGYPGVVWYEDLDADGYGGLTTAADCHPAVGTWSLATGDCDDSEPDTWPGALEVVGDVVDQDCDGLLACFEDLDGDSWGSDVTVTVGASDCDGAGSASRDGDCDDQDAQEHPGVVWYRDEDGDTFGFEEPLAQDGCRPDALTPWSLVDGDCDDGDAAVNPAAIEVVADGADQDCDGFEICYEDQDGDGYGVEVETMVDMVDVDSEDGCYTTFLTDALGVPVSGNASDCDDAEVAITGPGSTVYDDQDGDGFGDPDGEHVYDPSCALLPTPTFPVVFNADDCEDDPGTDLHPYYVAGLIHPGATYYQDLDADGWGVVSAADSPACAPQADYVMYPGDCDDDDAGIHPEQEEICQDDPNTTGRPDDLVDDDCGGTPPYGERTTSDLPGLVANEGWRMWSYTGGTKQRVGTGVAVGDFDGDGCKDLAVGASRYSNGANPDPDDLDQRGAVLLFFGVCASYDSPGGEQVVTTYDLPGSPDVVFTPDHGLAEDKGAGLGWDLASGDFDADGIDDLVAAAPYGNSGTMLGGQLYLIYGRERVSGGACPVFAPSGSGFPYLGRALWNGGGAAACIKVLRRADDGPGASTDWFGTSIAYAGSVVTGPDLGRDLVVADFPTKSVSSRKPSVLLIPGGPRSSVPDTACWRSTDWATSTCLGGTLRDAPASFVAETSQRADFQVSVDDDGVFSLLEAPVDLDGDGWHETMFGVSAGSGGAAPLPDGAVVIWHRDPASGTSIETTIELSALPASQSAPRIAVASVRGLGLVVARSQYDGEGEIWFISGPVLEYSSIALGAPPQDVWVGYRSDLRRSSLDRGPYLITGSADVDLDGSEDLILQVPQRKLGVSSAGRMSLLYASSDIPNSDETVLWNMQMLSSETQRWFGYRVVGEQVDGVGPDDMIITDPGSSTNSSGVVRLLFSGPACEASP